MAVWILMMALVVETFFLIFSTFKIYYMKKAANEIQIAVEEKLKCDTNGIIQISSHDATMKVLASTLNIQLTLFNEARQRYEYGDRKLQEAITNISHDLRTPLTAIYGYLSLLRTENGINNENEQRNVYLRAIENRVDALKELTEELFQYTMVRSDTEQLVLEPLNLNKVLESSLSAYYSVFLQKKITPQITMPEQIIWRTGNEQALTRVIENIINNAIKYSDGGLSVILAENGELQFSNHASGLTEIQVGRLLDRFYTVNNAHSSTGLGLSIAKTLIEKMGGTIAVDYTQDVLTFTVRLGNPEGAQPERF